MWTDKHVLVKNTFTKQQIVGLLQRACVENTVYEVEIRWLAGKE